MRIEILDEAQEDLTEGFRFYEQRASGLGSYFLDCLFSDIDSLLLYAGIHQVVLGYTDLCPNASHLPSTTAWRGIWFVYMPYWIVAGILYGPGRD